jgi:hypothetical protein
MANERTSMYLQPEVKQALTEYVERTKAESISAAANDLIQRGLVALSARDTGDVAAPAIAEAISRRVEELLRALVVQPLHTELAAIHHEATLARLEGFAHIANDYGPPVAERLEAAVEERAQAARAAGEVPHLNMALIDQTGPVA